MEISEPGEYALLGLLWDAPRHGYELHRAFDPGRKETWIEALRGEKSLATLRS